MQIRVEQLTTWMEELCPFNRYLGIKIEELREGYSRCILPFRDEFIGNPALPAIHGGVISTLTDVCGGTAVWTSCSEGDSVATLDIRVDYLRPGPKDDLVAESEVVRVGNRVAVGLTHFNIASIYSDNNQPQESLDHYFMSIDIVKDLKDARYLLYNYCSLSEVYIQLEDFEMKWPDRDGLWGGRFPNPHRACP